jgi:hypothetical protein
MQPTSLGFAESSAGPVDRSVPAMRMYGAERGLLRDGAAQLTDGCRAPQRTLSRSARSRVLFSRGVRASASE